MLKKLLTTALFLVAPTLFAQTGGFWSPTASQWVRIDGGNPAQAGVTPYSGTPVAGDMIYFNGTAWVSLNKPANGTYSITWTNSVPSWSAGGGGGLGDPGGNGMVARTALNTTAARTIACTAAYCSWTNGDGVAGAPTLTLSLAPATDGGGVVAQSSTPGTQQGSGGNKNFNLNGAGILEIDAIGGTGSTDGLTLKNTTAAISGTQQVSPALRLVGQGFDSGGSSSTTQEWRIYSLPVQASPARAQINFDAQLAGGGFTNAFSFLASGGCCSAWSLSSVGNVQAASTGKHGWTTSTQIANNSDGNISITTNAGATSSSVVKFGEWDEPGANGQSLNSGQSSELLPSMTSGTTVVSIGNLAPADSILVGMAVRITTGITCSGSCTSIDIRATGGNAFQQIAGGTTLTTLTVNTTYKLVPAAFADQYNSTAHTITITANGGGTFTAGQVRVTVYWRTIVPPTS